MAVFRAQQIFMIFLATRMIYIETQVNSIQETAKDWPPGWTEKCINCICEAATECNQTMQCIGQYCGMFLISRAYWIDAGNPMLLGDDSTSAEAFNRCVLDPYCASRTVNQYINKFIKDCNNDGTLSCDDYARLHYFGYVHCSRSVDDVPFYQVFQRCFFKS